MKITCIRVFLELYTCAREIELNQLVTIRNIFITVCFFFSHSSTLSRYSKISMPWIKLISKSVIQKCSHTWCHWMNEVKWNAQAQWCIYILHTNRIDWKPNNRIHVLLFSVLINSQMFFDSFILSLSSCVLPSDVFVRL